MPILRISSNKSPTSISSGITASNVSSSVSGNMNLIQAQINQKNSDYINVRNAVKILETYSNWNGYIKIYTEVENNFQVDDIVYISYIESITGSTIFNLENPSNPILSFDEFTGITFNKYYNGYKVLYTNLYKNEIVIDRYYNDIPAGSVLKYQYLSKVSCRGGNYFDSISDGIVFYNCNVFNGDFATVSGYVFETGATLAYSKSKISNYKISIGIEGAIISIAEFSTTSDFYGYYLLIAPVGTNYLTCSLSGYTTYSKLITLTKNTNYSETIELIPTGVTTTTTTTISDTGTTTTSTTIAGTTTTTTLAGTTTTTTLAPTTTTTTLAPTTTTTTLAPTTTTTTTITGTTTTTTTLAGTTTTTTTSTGTTTTTTTISGTTTTTTTHLTTTTTTTLAPTTTTTTTHLTTTTTTLAPTTTTTTTITGSTTTTTTSAFLGTTYYVSNTGNDALDGKSEINAWKTISKVNSSTFNAGDRILFNKGDTWREEKLTVPRSGTVGSYMQFGSYGTGNRPQIFGSKISTGWSDQGSNIWRSTTTFTDPSTISDILSGGDVFFVKLDGTVSWGIKTATLNADYKWRMSGSYIEVFSVGTPSSYYSSVEVPQQTYIIFLDFKNYLNFTGLHIAYCTEVAISGHEGGTGVNGQGLTIDDCEVGCVGIKNEGYGTEAYYSNFWVKNSEFHDCGRRAISLHLYADGFNLTNIKIEDNYFHDGYHTTGPDFSVGSWSGYGAGIDGVIIRRNLFYDPADAGGVEGSEQMFFQNDKEYGSGAVLRNIYIYSNIFNSSINHGINMEGTDNIYIYNNTFYNFSAAAAPYDRALIAVFNEISGVRPNINVNIKNNIFYTNTSTEVDALGHLIGELFLNSYQSKTEVKPNYNLYYRPNTSYIIVQWEGHYTYDSTEFVTGIQGVLQYELNSPTPANPNFVNPSINNFNVQAGSPAIHLGTPITVDSNFDGLDYEGNAYANPPTIGAFEY